MGGGGGGGGGGGSSTHTYVVSVNIPCSTKAFLILLVY